MKLPFHYNYDSNFDKHNDFNSIEKRIQLCYKRYFRFMRAINAINSDISLIMRGGVSYRTLSSKLRGLSNGDSIIIYDKRGLLFDHILRYINRYHELSNFNICVISDYLYPEYISRTLYKDKFFIPDSVFIDTSLYFNYKYINNNKYKLRFLLDLRDDFTNEFINILSEIKLLQHLLHIL